MEKSEPALKPEWLKSSNGSTGNSVISNHHYEHGIGGSSKNRLSSTTDRDRSSFSFSSRSLSSNGSRRLEKDNSGKSNAYTSFGRSNRSREREKEKDFDSLDRVHRSDLFDNGFHVHFDSLTTSRSEKDSLRRSISMVSGRSADAWSEGLGNNVNNGISLKGNIISGTFEKDFPSLGAEEKNVHVEAGRLSSPGIGGSSAISGVDNWNSVLVEVPILVRTNGLSSSSTLQAVNASPALVAPSSSTSLNMAETMAQAPSRARTPPELSTDPQRIDELTLRQCKQLIPVTPSAMKNSVSSSSEKLKNKGARGGDSGTVPKGGLQLSSQPVNVAARAPVRTDTTKPSQPGTFLVLNREKNGITSSTTKEVQNVSKVVVSAVGLSAKAPTNQKFRGEGKRSPLSSPQGLVLERRMHSQAKDRNEFFNLLRNKASNNSCVPSISVNSDRPSSAGGHGSGAVFSDCELKLAEDADDCKESSKRCLLDTDEMNACPEPVDAEEEAFLRSLGWDKFAEVDALTPEEIAAFYMKNKERMKALNN